MPLHLHPQELPWNHLLRVIKTNTTTEAANREENAAVVG
jgi:hypothetical protein